jgi:hypothetical protein
MRQVVTAGSLAWFGEAAGESRLLCSSNEWKDKLPPTDELTRRSRRLGLEPIKCSQLSREHLPVLLETLPRP